jgi:hypothetical protein
VISIVPPVLALLAALVLLGPASVDGRARAETYTPHHSNPSHPSARRRHAAARPINPTDVATTHAYLEAVYAYARALLVALQATRPALEGFAKTVADECPDILAQAPRPQFGAAQSRPLRARASGEARLHERQLEKLRSELRYAATLAYLQPLRAPIETFANTVSPLRWSNPVIAQRVQENMGEVMLRLQITAPNVCADLRAWVASDYKTLGTNTGQFLRTFRATRTRSRVSGPSLKAFLKPYESPADKRIISQTAQVAKQFPRSLPKVELILQHLHHTISVGDFVGGPSHVRRPELFSLQQQTGCQPHPYAIVYGLLKPPGAGVLAQVDGSTVPLHRLRLPASDHTPGVLAYAVLPTLPEKLLIRSARGRTLYTESLGAVGKETIETCEGETEG